MKYLFMLLAMIAISSCGKKAKPVAPTPTYTLSVTERTELNLPLENVLTLATKEDIEFAARLDAATIKAVEQSLEYTGDKVAIVAARPIGDYLLLWIIFPNTDDGAINLIWSVENQQIVGKFYGGEQG